MPLASTSTLPFAVSATLAGSADWSNAMEAPSESTAPAIAATKICLMIETPGFLGERLVSASGGLNFVEEGIFPFSRAMVQQNGRVAKPALEGSGSFDLARKE